MKNMSNHSSLVAGMTGTSIETEVSSGAELSFAELMARCEVPRPLSVGEVVRGTILPFANGSDFFVNCGQKADAVLPAREAGDLKHGDEAEFKVVNILGDEEGTVILSYTRLVREKAMEAAWETIIRLSETGDVTDAVIGDQVTKEEGGKVRVCGYEAKVHGIDAFIPASALASALSAAELKGKTVRVKVIKAERKRRFSNVVLSQKDAIEASLTEALASLTPGTVVSGVVSRIILQSKNARNEGEPRKEIGALVEFDLGVAGMVHKSEFADDPRVKPSDVVKVGDRVDVLIVSVDRESKRISLSFKGVESNKDAVAAAVQRCVDATKAQLTESFSKLEPGQIVSGRVKRIFLEREPHNDGGERREQGAIVVLPGGVEAFLHRNECSDSRLLMPSHLFKEGDVITAQIRFVDVANLKVQLSYKRVPANAEAIEAKAKELQRDFLASLKLGDRRRAVVTRTESYGVFCRIVGGIEGLMHIDTIEPNLSEQDSAIKRYRQGQSVEVEIIKIDVQNGYTRIGLAPAK